MFSSTAKLLLVTTLLVIFASIASAQAPAVAATVDPSDGYPIWYQDGSLTGIRVESCLYTNGTGGVPDPNCVLLADPGFLPGGPLVLGTNFPVEFFYFVADAAPQTTPGCPASGILPGKLKWRGALEGSFLTGLDQPGQQSSFTRTRIVASGLCPNTAYTFNTPFGVQTFTTNAAGALVANKSGATIDTGCAAAPCDFTAALVAPAQGTSVVGGFLQSAVAPAGYLGDTVTLSTITGSPAGTNFFNIIDPLGVVLATTDQFTVSGKIAGPLMASPSKIDFGGQANGTTSAPIPITITNVFPTAITVGGTPFTGVNAADFAVFSNTCLAPLARDATCVISVTFTPSTQGVENATLAVAHDGPFRSPLNISLTGTGTPAGAAPVVSLSAASLTFPPTRVRMLSAAQTITVTNSILGNAPLGATATIINVPPDPITGLPLPGADQFKITADTCTGNFVPVGLTCQVSVQYAPTVATVPPGATALLNFADNAANTPQQVTLTGTGTGGIAAVSTTAIVTNNFIDANGVDTGFPYWYQDENGVQLQPCLDPADPFCVLIPDPGFNGLPPVLYVANFPTEFFYFVADSDKMDTPGCPGLTGPTKITYRAAMEGSFAAGVAQVGQNTMFSRTKIVVPPGGLCPLTTYRFDTPYGSDLLTTDSVGGIVANKKGATVDVGCLGTCTGANDALPLSSRVFGGFLKWDPNVAPAAPAGHIGDAGFAAGLGIGTPHAVIGSPYIVPGETAPANFFRIADAATGAVLNGCADALGVAGPCQVNLFTVSGKLALSVHTSQVGTPGAVTFPPTIIGTASVAQTVTLTNGDAVNSVTMGAASVLIAPGGLASPDFSLGADTCSNVTLAPAATCTINVVFNPTTVAGLLAGVLVVPHAGLTDFDSPAEVPLSGIAQPAITATTTTIAAPTVTFPANGLVTVTVSPVLPGTVTPTGSVSLSVDGGAAITQALAAGATTFTLISPAAGTHTLSATYIPDPGFSTSSGTGSLLVNPAAALTTTSILAPTITYNASGVVTVTVSSAAGIPTGSVSLTVDGIASGSLTLDAAGQAVFTLISPAAGTHSLIASYAGNASFAASTSPLTNLTVLPAATATAITAPAVTFPSNASVTVTVSSAAGIPSGSVSLTVDGGAPITQALVGGSTTFTVTGLAVGNHALSATYAAQGNFAASSATGILTVNPATELITATATASRAKLLFSWVINGTTSIRTPHTMTVTLTRTGQIIGSTTTKANGSWKVTAPKSTVVPIVGDTITVTSNFGAGTTVTFGVTIK